MKHPLPLLALTIIAVSSHLYAITPFQSDTFDSTLLGWAGGGGMTNTIITSGGPAGAGDAYYEMSQTNFHLATKNTAQWTGDYLLAGVTGIGMDLNSFSFTDTGSSPNGVGPAAPLMYLMLRGNGGDWISNSPVSLTVGGGWEYVEFGLTASDLTYLSGGDGVLNNTLTTVTRLLLTHDYVVPTVAGSHPPHVLAVLGVDNITAIPEPSTLSYMLIFLFPVLFLRRRN